MRNRVLWLMVWLIPWLIPSPLLVGSARAEDWDYRGVIDAAVEAYQQERFEEAFALFSKAHSLKPSARTLRGMGAAAFETRRYAAAIRYLTDAIGDARSPLTPSLREGSEALIARASTFVVRLQLELEPADAEVSLDGQVLERAGDNPVLLDPGTHQLVARAKGYQVAVRSVSWLAGTQARLELHLSPEEAARTTGPSARVQPAAHDAPTSASTRDDGRIGAFKWVALGATAAAVVVTGVALGLREHRARKLEEGNCDAPDADPSCLDWDRNARSWRTTAIAAGAVGALVGASSIVLFAVDRRKKSAAAQALRACNIGVGGAPNLRCQLHF